MAKKASKKSPTPAEADPRPVLATRAHYRQAVVRLVRRQLDCARRGLIGSDEWFLAIESDFTRVARYSRMARLEAPDVTYFPPDIIPFDPPEELPARWRIREGIPIQDDPGKHAVQRYREIEGDRSNLVVRRAVNLLAVHVLEEWLEWVETTPERDLETDMMPASFFEPLKQASADNLRKWRDAGKIVGTKAGSGREVLYSVTSVLKHLRHHATMRDRLDAKWLEVNIAEDERKEPVPARTVNAPRAESRGNHRPTHPAPR